MDRLKGVYLCCGRARHFDYDIDYVDVDSRYGDIVADACHFDFSDYDFVIATPPCNWWSRANPYYKSSRYSLETKEILPTLLVKLGDYNKPFLVENVINKKRMREEGIWDLTSTMGFYHQFVGRHTYWTNSFVNLDCPQHQDFRYGGRRINNDGHNQGGSNVHSVVELWLRSYVCPADED